MVTLVTLAAFAIAAGLAHDANCMVSDGDLDQAEQILSLAAELRKDIAWKWLGHTLSEGDGRVVVQVSYDGDYGRTFVNMDGGDDPHIVWIHASSENLRSTLAHEIAHCVLATAFGDSLPAWAQEGIASQYDDVRRKNIRSRLRGNARLIDLLNRRSIAAGDRESYAAAESFVAFLALRGEPDKVAEFAVYGKRDGWNAAAERFYGISIGELESAWRKSR